MVAPFVKFGTSLHTGKLVGDSSNAHLMTIAPTGTGKGQTSIIPNLLTWPGSVFVIDPKGDNIKATIRRRCQLNEAVYLLDPFGIVNTDDPIFAHPSFKRARFNPLDLIEDGPAGITQADRLADTLIVAEGKENAHFSNEARTLLKALILHVLTAPDYQQSRDLGAINNIASTPADLVGDGRKPGEMQGNKAYYGLIARIAQRMAAKGDREGPAVWSTLQANLGQFLDDPRVALNLSRSDFDFHALKTRKISIFAVLPAPYLETFSRWLRLLVGTALDRLLLVPEDRDKAVTPVLVVLDEFAHLGYLEAVKTAYGLARSAGLKIWAILQSLSQLDEIYGEHGRENLVANSGALEIFNMSDNFGCEYFSKKAGDEYVQVLSPSHSVTTPTGDTIFGSKDGGSTSSSTSHSETLRPRMLPQEIGAMDPELKILFRRITYEGQPTYEFVRKVRWNDDPHLSSLAGL